MSNTVLVIGESGSGKSTSIRNLDPKSTFIINVLDKPLPFKGAKSNYVRDMDDHKLNYVTTDSAKKIINLIRRINEARPDIKTIIIDDFQYVMANEFMRRALEKGYEKFTEIGQNAWSILRELGGGRSDIDCFVLSHSDNDQFGKIKCKTIGKMLDDKISIEGMFTIVLHAITTEGKYKFLTQNDGIHVAKAPMEMFNTPYIDNDLKHVKDRMYDYFNEDIPV